nr:MAG TPA: hypothetical protein [Caudoviricetes sp.]
MYFILLVYSYISPVKRLVVRHSKTRKLQAGLFTHKKYPSHRSERGLQVQSCTLSSSSRRVA